jgi:hypothetical protein
MTHTTASNRKDVLVNKQNVIRETGGSTTKTRNNISQLMQPQRGRRAVTEYGSLGRTAQGHLGIDEKS